MLPMVYIVRTMGNLWTTTKVRPIHGTYLEERPRRKAPAHHRVASFIPIVEPLRALRQKVPYKEKALRIFHEVGLRRDAFNRGILPQGRE
jgi:hypothetical protein